MTKIFNMVLGNGRARISCLCWVVLIGGISVLPCRAATPLVKGVSFSPSTSSSGYVVRFRTTQRISAYRAPQHDQDDQIKFVIYNAALADSYQKVSPKGPVRSYSVRSRHNRLLFRFHLKPNVEITTNAYRDRSSTDLLLNLSYDFSRSGRRAAVTNGRSSGAGRNREGDRWRLDTIVLDAGHGGHDPGAQAYGLDEKDIVLAITLKLGQYIENNMNGVDVIYTRDKDRFVALRERGRIANRAGAKLFVSIHANASRNHSAHGTETYFLGMHKTETAERVMKRENSVIQLEENPNQYEGMRSGAIMQSLAQSAYMRKSEELSGLIQKQFATRIGRKNRGVRQAGFLVLWAASMPAILVETGFLTNASEATFLSSDKGQAYIASAIFRAIRDYKKQYEKGLNLSAQQ